MSRNNIAQPTFCGPVDAAQDFNLQRTSQLHHDNLVATKPHCTVARLEVFPSAAVIFFDHSVDQECNVKTASEVDEYNP